MGPRILTHALQGDRASSGIQVDPKVQDLMDPGVNLCCAQLLGGGIVGVAWPWIHPHLGSPLPEQLNPAAKICLQKVRPS
jgi:hypothetical protein